MKKILPFILLALIALSACSGTDSGDTAVSTDTEDTAKAILPHDTGEPETTEAGKESYTADTEQQTDSDILYISEGGETVIKKLEDGTYEYNIIDSDGTPVYSRVFDNAVYMPNMHSRVQCDQWVFINQSGLYTPDPASRELQLRITSDNIRLYGDYIVTHNYVYEMRDYVYCSILYDGDGITDEEIEYDPETGVIILKNIDADGIVTSQTTYYPALESVTDIPDNTPYISDDWSSYIPGTGTLYCADDGYYHNFDGSTVKLPLSGNYFDVRMASATHAIFVSPGENGCDYAEYEIVFCSGAAGTEKFGYTVKEYSAPEQNTMDYNGATVHFDYYYAYIEKDGEIIGGAWNDSSSAEIVGDMLVFYNYGYGQFYTVYKPDLTKFAEGEFGSFYPLSDGNFLAHAVGNAANCVYSPDGEIVYSWSEDIPTDLTGSDFVFSINNGVMQLYTPYGELVCELGTVTDSMRFHWMLSGAYEKDGVKGYYFIFEDSADTDKDGNYRDVEYYYIPSTGESGMIDNGYSSFAYAKPVLYLYPEDVTDVTVTFECPERLTTVYPAYNDGWSVTAKPDGTLTDSRGREYYALYWEESALLNHYSFTDGFCVKGEDSAAFLEEKLAALGFTQREANEFIIYWLPIMEANEYNLIRFELTAEREAANTLHITPKPDSLLRMAMHIKASDEPVEIPGQELPAFHRIGFAAVEWGGCVH